MNKTLSTALLISLLTLLAGCTEKMPAEAKLALQSAEKIEFYSLNPIEPDESTEGEKFNGWLVLGETIIEAEETRNTLVDSLRKGVNASDGSVAGCFNPRHGIRVTHNDKVHDFVICFECLQVQWIIDSERQPGFLTTDSPARAFNKILKDADVPLPSSK